MTKKQPPSPDEWELESAVSEAMKRAQGLARLGGPPAPPGWKKTLADLHAELKSGVRRTLGSPEVDWARDYERILLPADTRFPRQGDVYEAMEDLQVHYLTSWQAPFTGGGKGTMRRGEQVVVRYLVHPQPIAVGAHPMNYHEVEARLVPETDRRDERYGGFYLSISTADLNAKFRLVQEGGGGGSAHDQRADTDSNG